MAIALVREGVHDSTGTATASLTGVDITAGSTVVIICHPKTGGSQDVTSVTDSAGNTYVNPVTAYVSGTNSRCSIWYCFNATGMSAGTVTVTMSSSLSLTTNISEWTGIDTAATPVSFGQGNAASTTPPACTVTTTEAGDLVIGAISQANATAPTLTSAGFTALTGSSPAATWYGAQAYEVAGSAGTYGPTWTLAAAVGTGAATIAFKPAATGGTDASVTAVVATATGSSAGPTVSASSSVQATATSASAGLVAPSVSASATVTAVVATATGTAVAPSVSANGNATVNAVVATATGAALAPTVGATNPDATVAAVAATATGTMLAPAVSTVNAVYVFTPPTFETPMRTSEEPLRHYRLTQGMTVIRNGGSFQTIQYPTSDQLTAAGENGVDFFMGGYVYEVGADTAAQLQAAGYTLTLAANSGRHTYGHGAYGSGPYGV